MTTYVIGVDPGGTTGICLFDGVRGDLVQSTPDLVVPIVSSLMALGDAGFMLAIERFVVGPRASRSSTAKAGEVTRELIGALVSLSARLGIHVVQRSASEVKPWATDKRLAAAGLRVKGMPHAADAARHALYAAVKDAGLPDPLSRTTRPAPRRTP